MTHAEERPKLTPREQRAVVHELRDVGRDLGRAYKLTDKLRTRRDFLVVAAYRRGASLRVIAKAAGVHYTRVRQLVRVSDEVKSAPGIDLDARVQAPPPFLRIALGCSPALRAV